MTKSEAENKFDRYCGQLEKYGRTESVHSPNMSLLRRKARKQLIELLNDKNEESDHSHKVSKLWNVGYYRPYQYFVQNAEKSHMEISTLLTIFCGELHEILEVNDKYSSLLNLFLGDLHRYFPDDELQKMLAEGFYRKSIQQDPRGGRAYYALSLVKRGVDLVERIRLLLLAQLAPKPYDTIQKLEDLITEPSENAPDLEMFISEFVAWSLFHTTSKSEHHKKGAELVANFRKIPEFSDRLTRILEILRLTAMLAMERNGYPRFLDCFDVISEVHLFVSKNSEVDQLATWILFSAETFEKHDERMENVSNYSKSTWSNLIDALLEQLNGLEMLQEHTEIVEKLLTLKPQIFYLENGKFHRETETSPKHQFQSIAPFAHELEMLQMLQIDRREDWKPIYIIMAADTIRKNLNFARRIWKSTEFISILPSSVLAELDNQKTSNPRGIRPILRALEDAQRAGEIQMRRCEDAEELAEQLVKNVKDGGHSNIVAFLCEEPESHVAIEGVTFYRIEDFWKMCLE